MSLSSVNSGTGSVKLLSSNSQRKSLIIKNTDANTLYVLLDSGTASSSNHSFEVASGAQIEVPSYGGEVNGVWAGDGSGVALVTEIA